MTLQIPDTISDLYCGLECIVNLIRLRTSNWYILTRSLTYCRDTIDVAYRKGQQSSADPPADSHKLEITSLIGSSSIRYEADFDALRIKDDCPVNRLFAYDGSISRRHRHSHLTIDIIMSKQAITSILGNRTISHKMVNESNLNFLCYTVHPLFYPSTTHPLILYVKRIKYPPALHHGRQHQSW